MDKFVDKTVGALSRFGERLERRLSTDESDNSHFQRSGSGYIFPSAGSAFHRPVDKKNKKKNEYSSKQRDLIYGGARNYSSDNLAASPGYSSFNNYRQNPMPNPYANEANGLPYGTGIGGPSNYNYNQNQNQNYGYGSNYGDYSGGYSDPSSGLPYGTPPGSVGYAPDYYIAERRQVELVPAPPPRIIQQRVPVPYPVDRPVPQPYPVDVPRYIPVDRPVPVPVPTPVPVDRPVPVPFPVPVPSPPPPPICIPVPVPVPSPVPYYIPVGIPVPSPPPSPVMFEQSVTHTQRWVTGSPCMMNQQYYSAGSPVMMNQQQYSAGSPVMMNQQRYAAGSPAMGMNPYMSYGNGSYIR